MRDSSYWQMASIQELTLSEFVEDRSECFLV